MFVLNFKVLYQIVPEKSLTKISICITLEREIGKEKRINKATDKHYVADLLIHSTTFYT